MINEILRDYLVNFPEEEKKISIAVKQAENTKNEAELFNRKNFIGHFTSSIFLLCPKEKKILLIEHKILKKFLQPGGHIEIQDNNPLDAALRELYEETKLSREQVLYRPLDITNKLVPIHISSHYIPENQKKKELGHYHHDLEYLFIIEKTEDIIIDKNESNGFQWVDMDIFQRQEHFADINFKIKELLSKRSAISFFDRVFNSYVDRNKINKQSLKDVRCIAVQHILPSTYDFILYLNKIFGKVIIYAKPKSIDYRIKECLEKRGIKIRVAKRVDSIIQYYLDGDTKTKTILLDIGGYFSSICREKNKNIIGIIEDTENGLQKYESFFENSYYKIASVARSCLKDNEDMLVGKSIVNAADAILREENILINYSKCAIIGYGKVGEGIARSLLENNIKPYVIEKNPIRALKAVNNFCYIQSMENALRESKVIFCATGQKSLDIINFRNIRNGAYVVSVTSNDDEFDMQYLKEEYNFLEITDHITKIYNNNNYFYLINDGHAPNFIFNAAIGSFIYPVLAECLCLMINLLCNSSCHETNIKKEIIISTMADKQNIAKEWIEEFISPKLID